MPVSVQSPAIRPSASTVGRPDSAFETLLAAVAEGAYGVALCPADGEATAVERLQEALTGACRKMRQKSLWRIVEAEGMANAPRGAA